MSENIIQSPLFRENLDDWLFKNRQESAEFLFKNKEKIPQIFRNYKHKLFRGISVSEEVISLLEADKFVTRKHTSWSKSEAVAKKFTLDPAYRISNNAGDKLVRVILTKTIVPTCQILDIESFVLFMGLPQLEMLGYDETNLDSAIKEQEVLVSKEIKVSRKEYKIIK